MATVSVEISDSTKAKIQRQAKTQGVTSHALMVSAIESVVSQTVPKPLPVHLHLLKPEAV